MVDSITTTAKHHQLVEEQCARWIWGWGMKAACECAAVVLGQWANESLETLIFVLVSTIVLFSELMEQVNHKHLRQQSLSLHWRNQPNVANDESCDRSWATAAGRCCVTVTETLCLPTKDTSSSCCSSVPHLDENNQHMDKQQEGGEESLILNSQWCWGWGEGKEDSCFSVAVQDQKRPVAQWELQLKWNCVLNVFLIYWVRFLLLIHCTVLMLSILDNIIACVTKFTNYYFVLLACEGKVFFDTAVNI